MIQINNAKLLKVYDHSKNEFEKESNIQMRERAGIKVLAYGWNDERERMYSVVEIESPESVKQVLMSPEGMQAIQDAGVDMTSMEMIPLT
ncbi:uncharacterized protein METZ01_LOCUS193545 [marine metagenome]|uniref:GYD domain-containing protein n=1 Tax=marine metagenome TaxID=408172 RepID=A0A382DSH5_9ZZZZ